MDARPSSPSCTSIAATTAASSGTSYPGQGRPGAPGHAGRLRRHRPRARRLPLRGRHLPASSSTPARGGREETRRPADEDERARRAPPACSRRGAAGQPAIQDLLTEGQGIVVQVAKDPIGTKGARAHDPHRAARPLPRLHADGRARRHSAPHRAGQGAPAASANSSRSTGRRARASSSAPSARASRTEALKRTWSYLLAPGSGSRSSAKDAQAPALAALRPRPRRSAWSRDVFDETSSAWSSTTRTSTSRCAPSWRRSCPTCGDRVHLYRGAEPIFDTFGVENEIAALARPQGVAEVGRLPGHRPDRSADGDRRELGQVTSASSSLEDTTLRINLEAVEEVVYQLRLRNIGGIIIIDFIDMEKERTGTRSTGRSRRR